MFNAKRISIAGRLISRPLVRTLDRPRSNAPLPKIVDGSVEYFRKVCVSARDWRALQRASKIAVTAVRRAPLGQIKTPISRWGNWLQLAFGRRRYGDGKCRFGKSIGCFGRHAETIGRQFNHFDPKPGTTFSHCDAVRPISR